ncbi:hypothetical protein ACFQ2B_30525 [Streptomyces stramineus]
MDVHESVLQLIGGTPWCACAPRRGSAAVYAKVEFASAAAVPRTGSVSA